VLWNKSVILFSTCLLKRTVRTNRFFQMNRSFQRYHLRPWATCDLWLAVPVSFLRHRVFLGWAGLHSKLLLQNETNICSISKRIIFVLNAWCEWKQRTVCRNETDHCLFFTLRKELRWIRCRQRVNLCFCLTLILSD